MGICAGFLVLLHVIIIPHTMSERVLFISSFLAFVLLVMHVFMKNQSYILEQKKTQERISAIHELSSKMITFLDEEKIIRSTIETAQKILDFQFCDFLLIDTKTGELVVRDSIGKMANIIGRRIPMDGDKGISVAVAKTGKAISLPDVSKDVRYIPARFDDGSELCVPVIIKERVIGAINVEKNEHHAFSEVDELLLSELSAQAAIAIENARLNRRIVESERQYRTVINNIGIGVSLISPGMQILFLNDQMKQWFPHIRVDERPICYKAFNTPPREEICSYCPTHRTLQDGMIHHSRTDTPLGDKIINYGVTSFPVRNEQGDVIAAIEIFEDITERKHFEKVIIQAKEEWEHTFDSVPDLILLIDREHRIFRLNRAMAERLGIEPREAIGKLCHEIIHDSQQPPDSCFFTKLKEQRGVQSAEMHLESLGGDFLVTISPLTQDGGEAIGAVHVFRDITERKKMEEALKESEEKYRAVAEESITGVYILQDGKFKFVNKRFCEFFGYSYEEITDRLGSLDLTYPEDRHIVQQNIDARMKGHSTTSEYEIRALKKNGEIFPIRVFGSIATYKGKPAIIGTLLDLSQEKGLELQLIRAQKMESLGQLAGGIAHDFNNVLGIIMGSLDLLQREEMSDRTKKLVDMAKKASERGSEIVKRLLIFARAEETRLVPVSLSSIIDETLSILEHTLEKNIVIKKNLCDTSDVIFGNKEQLTQMIINICMNARDAMPSGGILTLSLEKKSGKDLARYFADAQEEDYLVLHISDTGSGMDAKTRERIFDPFFTTKERGKGTGLGLAIVHSIIRNHKALINVTSSPGMGTTFSIYLPVAPAFEVMKEVQQDEKLVIGGKETVLVVDDEENIRDVLKELLSSLGYTIIEASNGAEALARFKEKQRSINLTILDIGLPGMSGDQVLSKLREMDPHLPVIIASGYLDASKRSELERLGVKTIIQKPYTLKEAAAAIRKAIDEESAQRN